MKSARLLAAVALSLAATCLAGAAPALAAGGFQCPARPLEVAGDARIQAALPTGDALDNVEMMNTAVTTLRGQGVSPVLIIDGMIAAYCPNVAARSGLTDAQKAALANRFAARLTRTVYALDGADAVILDVAFPPAAVDAINAKASAGGVSAEAWIRGTVESALK
jgi:hypothetical protein